MGEKTAIGWTDATFNGWIGCDEVGPGCVPCYARELDRRYQYGVPAAQRAPGLPAKAPNWGPNGPRHRTSVGYWRQPLLWNKRAQAAGKPIKVFAHSLSDVFDNAVDDAWRADLFALWHATPWLRWIVLTKRVPNIRKMLPPDWGDGYPNVGLVATTVNQEEFDRDAPRLLGIPARWHGFSIEPQLGEVDPLECVRTANHRGSIWLITGGESAQGKMVDKDTGQRRVPVPWNPEWARLLIGTAMACDNMRVFVKQTGAAPVDLPEPHDGAGSDSARWPAWMRVQDFVPELVA